MSLMPLLAEAREPVSPNAAHDAQCCTWCGLPFEGVRRSSSNAGLEGNGAALRRAGDVNPLMLCQMTGKSGHLRTPLANQTEAMYCCFGCRMAHAITEEKGLEGAVRWTTVRLGIAIFFSMNLMAFTMTMWSLDVYDVQRDPFQTQLFEVFRWLSMIFSLPVLLLLGVPMLQNAMISARQRIFSTDLLIATGVTAAYGISVANVLRSAEAVYFEVGATVLVMVTLGRWFEATGKQKAIEALDQLADLLPSKAQRVTDADVAEIACVDIVAGDRLQIRAGERFPTDAILIDGETTVD